MAPTPTFYLLKPERVEPASDALSWLGRITANPAAPDANFTPTAPQDLLAAHAISETKIANASAFVSSSVSKELSTQLTGLISTLRSRQTTGGLQISTSSIRYLRMQNHDTVLDALREDADVKRDLARMMRPGGEPAYLIVGMLIWRDAEFIDRREQAKGAEVSIEVPVTEAVTASTGVVLPGLNPSVGSGKETVRERGLEGFSEGDHIFAFEYRVIRRRIFSLGSNFTPRLGGYGGRVQKDALFGHDSVSAEEKSVESKGVLVLDAEDDEWFCYLDEEPVVETICGVSLAYDNTDTS